MIRAIANVTHTEATVGKHALKTFSFLKILHNEPESMAALPSLRMLEWSAIDGESGAISSRQTAVRQSNVEDEAHELTLVGFFDACNRLCVQLSYIAVATRDILGMGTIELFKASFSLTNLSI